MDKELFNLKMAVKQLERMAKKAEKEHKSEKGKVKTAMQKGNMDNARVHAENAIRQKNQHTQFLRMAARIDAVTQRVQTAMTMRQVTGSMKGVVKAMDKAMASMNLLKVSQLMEDFEKQFENLDVQSSVMEGAMLSTTASTMPEGEVDGLLGEVADENGLELNLEMGQVSDQRLAASAEEDTDLADRLAKLRNN